MSVARKTCENNNVNFFVEFPTFLIFVSIHNTTNIKTRACCAAAAQGLQSNYVTVISAERKSFV